ncbi:Protein of unknown function DUF4228 [Macleaya cordata]|uniref:DUF4228 domain-containing protein n=1 Tax=Macleaya cordata TaxID=56857 RepID=A0A200Q2M1_MACCD|nr:Protein of unknown function DUF4228 [Macleaya cordata]
MGNCVFNGFTQVVQVIKVATSNGGIMEFYTPITAESITNEFPGHGIYKSRSHSTKPLLHNEELLPGELYFLLPLNTGSVVGINKSTRDQVQVDFTKPVIINPTSATSCSSSFITPYRMSFDNQGILKRSDSEVIRSTSYGSSGVWKVKLVISPEQLSEILSHETSTEALVNSVRTVAKCGNGVPSSSSLASSDQWSLSSSWKASSDNFFT